MGKTQNINLRELRHLPECLVELKDKQEWAVCINPCRYWNWFIPEDVTAKPSKMRTTPDRQTQWLSPEDAVSVVMGLADRGFAPEGPVGSKFDLIFLIKTERGVLFCNKNFESFSLGAGSDLLTFDPQCRYYDIDEITLKCTDVYGKLMEPTDYAQSEINVARVIRRIESHGLFRDGVFKHGMTMQEAWSISSAVSKDYLQELYRRIDRVAKQDVRLRATENKKRGRAYDFGMKECFFISDGDMTIIAKVCDEDFHIGALVRLSPDKLLVVNKNVMSETTVVLQHFFDRYMERNHIDKDDFDIAIKMYLKESFENTITVEFDKVRNRVCLFMALKNGIALGTAVQDGDRRIAMVKTFVPENMLAEQQLKVLNDLRDNQKRNQLIDAVRR
jgi:hypothetical protein